MIESVPVLCFVPRFKSHPTRRWSRLNHAGLTFSNFSGAGTAAVIPTGRMKLSRGKAARRLTSWTLLRSVSRRSLALGSGIIALSLAVAFGSSLALFVATYEAQKQADARFVVGSDLRVTPALAVRPFVPVTT